MDSLWWWIFFGAIGLLGCLLGCIENYNFRKIVKQFSRGDHSLTLKRMAEEERDCLVNEKFLLLLDGVAKRQIKTLNFIILTLSFYNGDYEEFFSLVEEKNYEDRFQVLSFLLSIHSLFEKDFSSAAKHCEKFRSSSLPQATKENALLFLDVLLAHQQGNTDVAMQGAEKLASSKNLFIKHVCACVLENREIEEYRLPGKSAVSLKLLSIEKKKTLQKIWFWVFIVVFFVCIFGRPTPHPTQIS